MKKIYAPKNPEKRFLLLSLFLVLCLPLIVWQIVNENFDLRNMAFEEVQVSETNPCVISFPNVNPYTLQVGSTIRIQVEGIAKGSGITSLLITDSTGEELFVTNYEENQKEIFESFEFTPIDSKEYEIIGTLSEDSYSTACVISSPYDVKGIRAVANNNAPRFTSNPTDSDPSQDIDTGVRYEYTLTAQDDEKDTINYAFSFTPTNNWLKHTIINDGSNGELKIQFSGTTNEAGSYLANVFIHDGYSKHLRSQSWIISVNPAENDIPNVIVLSPWEALTITQGTPLTIKWSATDNNHIVSYQLYLAQSVQDESTWVDIDKNISYKQTEYEVDTSNISAGIYKAVVRATDNQEPALIGQGVSQTIQILGEEFENIPDDKVLLPDPQIINFTPTSEEDVTNPRVTIRASLLSSINAEINEDSIEFKLDGQDLTEKVKFNKVSEQEYTLIYQPDSDLDNGIHKVDISFSDTNDLSVDKSWTFTINLEQRDPSKLYIFGFEVGKTVALIIGGGILLILLAIITPLIIVKVWKDDKEVEESDPIIMQPQQVAPVNNFVDSLPNEPEANFNTPQIPTTSINDESETNDMSKLINSIKEEEANPPEPIL